MSNIMTVLAWTLGLFSLSLGVAWAEPAIIDFETLPGGAPTFDGLQLTNQYGPDLVFELTAPATAGAEVLRCESASRFCVAARSGSHVVTGPLRDEFYRNPVIMTFGTAQTLVSLYVRIDHPVPGTVRVSAFDESGALVSDGSKVVTPDAWEPFSVFAVGPCPPGDPNPLCLKTVIRRVEVSAPPPVNNFVLVDDVSIDVTTPPPPADTELPTVQIDDPAPSTTLNARAFDLRVRASDNVQVREVTYRVTDASGNEVDAGTLCGPGFSSCPPGTGAFTVSDAAELPALNGPYTIVAEACDPSSNCQTTTRSITLDLPPPPPDVSGWRLEMSQGVQWKLFDLSLGSRTESSPVAIVPEKPIVVRVYTRADGADRPGYTATLKVTFLRRGGGADDLLIAPNAGTSSITVPARPSASTEEALLWAMRADLTRTLNYVIPGGMLDTGVELLGLSLWDGDSGILLPVTGELQIGLQDPVRLGLNIVRIADSVAGPAPTDAQIDGTLLGYLQQAYPVSEVRVLSRRTIGTGRPSDPCASMSDCSCVLWLLQSLFGGGDAPVRTFTPDRSVIPTLGVISNPLPGALGCAYIEDPSDERVGVTALTALFADTAAQEIGHTLGLIHASNSHGEAGGGDAEGGWPYEHGTIGAANFGLIARVLTAPGPADAGAWRIALVDPCPGQPLAQRLPVCTLPDDTGGAPFGLETHDFMSYGGSTTAPGPFTTSKGRWISDITYQRIYLAIRDGTLPDFRSRRLGAPSTTGLGEGVAADAEERVEALVIDGLVDPDGSGGTERLFPVLRKPLPRAYVEREGSGEYELELADAAGNVLLSRAFTPTEATGSGDRHFHFIKQVVPYVPGLARVVIRRAGATIIEETASLNAPTVRVLSPNGGEVLTDGTHQVSWEAADADGDALTFLVQYSPDGGRTWEGVGILGGDERAVDIEVADLPAGSAALVRVMASDGLRTAVDISDCPFALGTDIAAECGLCGNGVVDSGETCDDGNQVEGCREDKPQKPIDGCRNNCTLQICDDPARIKVGPDGFGAFFFHGRVEPSVPGQGIDPRNKTFAITLTSPDVPGDGVVYSSTLSGGIDGSARRYTYRNHAARSAGGIAKLRIIQRSSDSYAVSIMTYGDLRLATNSMTTHLYIGDQEWTVTGTWMRTAGAWYLR